MAGPLCRVCSSGHRKEIDAALLDETTSLRDITAKFGIARSTLHNHKKRCMGAPTVPDTATRTRLDNEKREKLAATSRVAYLESTLPSREEIGDRLGGIADRLEEISSACQEEGSMALSIGALDKMRASLDSIARLAGHVGTGAAVQVNTQVNVSISAADIGAAMALHLGTVKPSQLIEATADEY